MRFSFETLVSFVFKNSNGKVYFIAFTVRLFYTLKIAYKARSQLWRNSL